MERFFHKQADEFSENSRSKDRIVISMATAALGFSLAIFSDPDRDLDPDMWLGIGWVAFAVSIVSVLLTYDLLSWLILRNLDKLVEGADYEALKAERDAAEEARKEVESELEALRERLAAIKAENEAVPETHDWNEDKTRRLIIDLALQRAGWPLDQAQDREYEVTGMPNKKGIGYADYVLWGDDGKPLAVVEAKKTTVDPEVGQQQAKLYADCLEAMHGQRPIIFYTNGYKTRLWDDLTYPPRA
ncbi:MAG: type I restriction enzyme HsdR N-terminal domain-containing protein, partial [Acidobacteria bacterium]|nr:type I restriction enzyme HsdR N-terminal domain-containing protein [Acidobacteriota bacterium]